MNYVIKPTASNKIRQFYQNVAKKYKHTYSLELMMKNIDDAINNIYQIERCLMRRKPTISRWEGLFMATSKDGKWNFAYRIEENTIYIEDACHSQNMHEQVIRLTESKFKQIIVESIMEIIKRIV